MGGLSSGGGLTPPGLTEVPAGHFILTLTFLPFFCFFLPLLFSCLQPEELEALHSHTFRVKTFKKAKHCSVCKQTIIQDGLICRGQSPLLRLFLCGFCHGDITAGATRWMLLTRGGSRVQRLTLTSSCSFRSESVNLLFDSLSRRLAAF